MSSINKNPLNPQNRTHFWKLKGTLLQLLPKTVTRNKFTSIQKTQILEIMREKIEKGRENYQRKEKKSLDKGKRLKRSKNKLNLERFQ